MVKGLASATHEAFANPGLVLLILAVTVLSAGFHEFGHAAAARRGGATPGAMGTGLYLIWPAFYTDVTDSYRLGRGGRLRTDLGGLYFNAIVAVAIMGIWWATGFDALLLVVVTQILQMVRQLLPLVRFDGYHILADATGVPDLFQRIKPTLLGLAAVAPDRPRGAGSSSPGPAPWSPPGCWSRFRCCSSAWSLMVLSLPRLLGTAWDSGQKQQAMLPTALPPGTSPTPPCGSWRSPPSPCPCWASSTSCSGWSGSSSPGLWQKTRGKALQRATALAADRGGVGRPRLGLVARRRHLPPGPALRARHPGRRHHRRLPGRCHAAGMRGGPGRADRCPLAGRAPEAHPRGAAAEHGPGAAADGTAGTAAGHRRRRAPPSWVFPFDQPAAPEEDGNQSLAVNTTDGSVVYDVAFALVWADDGEHRGHPQRGLRLRQLRGLRRRGRGLPGGPDRGPDRRDRPGKPLGGRELQLRPVPDLRPGQPAGPDPGRAPERRRHGQAQRAVAGDRRLRAEPAERAALGDPGPASAYKEQIMAVIKADPSATPAGSAGTAPPRRAAPRREPASGAPPAPPDRCTRRPATGGSPPGPAAPAGAPRTVPAAAPGPAAHGHCSGSGARRRRNRTAHGARRRPRPRPAAGDAPSQLPAPDTDSGPMDPRDPVSPGRCARGNWAGASARRRGR